MKMPNFLIIGAPKAGTSTIYDYLNQHPQIYMSPEKEPMFFAFKGEKMSFCGPGDDQDVNYYAVTDIETYCNLFKGVSNEIAIGEASTTYLYSQRAPGRIHHHLPNAKLIAILRNPVDRAYSNFLHFVRDCREPLTDFTQALEQEEIRIHNNWGYFWHYRHQGFYYGQLKRYFNTFDQGQIKVYLYEDFTANPLSLLQDIFQFLGIDETFVPDMSIRLNVSGIPKNKALNNFLREPNPIKDAIKLFLPDRLGPRLKAHLHRRNLAKPELSPEVRAEVLQVYREDLLKLQDLIERDLSKWLE
ncbi:MAG: sulfotransferase [Symploca sp. SIO2E9]|nr:sulfotransferase [Symploca sp. SIO2E9]